MYTRQKEKEISKEIFQKNKASMNKKDRSKILLKLFAEEWRQRWDYLSIPNENSISWVIPIISELCKIPFEKSIIEFSKDDAVRFSFVCNEGIILLITIPVIKPEGWKDNNVVYAITANRELLAVDCYNLKEFIPKIVDFLKETAS